MSDDALAEFAARAVALDLETHAVTPGLAAPPLVCGSLASQEHPDGEILPAPNARRIFDANLETFTIIVGANIAFDMVVIAAEAYRESIEVGDRVLAAIFAKYDRDEVYDVQIAEMLNAIAGGHLGKDPRSGGPIRDPHTGKQAGRYNLSAVTDMVLGRVDAKQNDFWRLRYAILERVAMSAWPAAALQYPKDDARGARDIALAQVARHRNLINLPAQCRSAFALALASAWGFRTNPAKVDALEAAAVADRDAGRARWVAAGFVDEDGGKEGRELKRRLARAYGAHRPCPACNGTGKVLNATGKSLIYCTDKAAGAGRGCDGTGLDLSDAPLLARTPTGGVKAGRDELHESGDEELMGFAEYAEDDKLFNVYIPFLREGCERPLNPRPNVLVASGRTSYDGVIQLIPRDGGVRECFEPRPGFVYVSTDYSSGELCTLAQVTLITVGRSKMAEVINATKDPGMLHTAYGAKLVGTTPEDLKARIKAGDKAAAGYRQAAKALNFGLPGGMGAAKLVLAKRKKSEGKTTAPDGRVYNGIRFCVLVGGAERCGERMITEWKGRPSAPVCRRCVELAEDLKREWLAFFDEMPAYFEFISNNVDMTGELEQLFSGRIRGGLSFCDGANTLFQGLLADGAKRALWMISREMYTDRNSPLYGCRLNAFFHDETFGEHPEWNVAASAPRQAELMEQGLREVCPDVYVECKPAAMRAWSKAAEPVYDAEGRFQVWMPKERK